jgi:hypothetical protein
MNGEILQDIMHIIQFSWCSYNGQKKRYSEFNILGVMDQQIYI